VRAREREKWVEEGIFLLTKSHVIVIHVVVEMVWSKRVILGPH
jgi:hypothetical protein